MIDQAFHAQYIYLESIILAVYVDDMRASFRSMIMCHMIADTHEELMAMARKIGVQAKWIQKGGTPQEHFDISLSKKALAIKAGAISITWRQLGLLTLKRRGYKKFSQAQLAELVMLEELANP